MQPKYCSDSDARNRMSRQEHETLTSGLQSQQNDMKVVDIVNNSPLKLLNLNVLE